MERTLKELKKNIKVVGLTGAIGSGKTVVTDALKNAGFYVIDADEVSREVVSDSEIVSLFPAAAKNGKLDRKALRAIIGSDDAERKRLNEFTHPKIVAEITRRVKSANKNSRTVLTAPLLFETGLSSLCDCIVCVYAPRELRISRITARDGVSRQDASGIADAQMSDTYRATLSDFCISSDRPKEEFVAEAVNLFDKIFDPSKR